MSKVLAVNLLARKSLGHDGQVCLNRTLRENRITSEIISRKSEITLNESKMTRFYIYI